MSSQMLSVFTASLETPLVIDNMWSLGDSGVNVLIHLPMVWNLLSNFSPDKMCDIDA